MDRRVPPIHGHNILKNDGNDGSFLKVSSHVLLAPIDVDAINSTISNIIVGIDPLRSGDPPRPLDAAVRTKIRVGHVVPNDATPTVALRDGIVVLGCDSSYLRQT